MSTDEQREQEIASLKLERAEYKRQQIENAIQMVKKSVSVLLQLLPDEQKHLGSECEIIDSTANDLYHKYAKRGSE